MNRVLATIYYNYFIYFTATDNKLKPEKAARKVMLSYVKRYLQLKIKKIKNEIVNIAKLQHTDDRRE